MQLRINGEVIDIQDQLNVCELLKLLELSTHKSAVEINREIIKKSDYRTKTVNDGDQIEIVNFVGGG